MFGNIEEIHELTVTLLNSMEDAQEMCDEGNDDGDDDEEETVRHHPPVGVCFEDLALVSLSLYADVLVSVSPCLLACLCLSIIHQSVYMWCVVNRMVSLLFMSHMLITTVMWYQVWRRS